MFGLDPKDLLLVLLAAFTLFYVWTLIRTVRAHRADVVEPARPSAATIATGFVTNFLDTLGIGSYATTTAIFRKWKLVPDEKLPGTLNVGHTIPTIAEAFIFTKIVPVEATTLLLMIGAAVVGAWLGAGVVARWPRRKIQVGMGSALVVAAFLMLAAFAGNVGPDFGSGVVNRPVLGQIVLGLRALASLLHPLAAWMPKGGSLLGLHGASLAYGMAGNFILGALMTLGIGLYAPCMILIYFLGMQPTAAFPIMMGSCAFLMPVASARFVKERSYNIRAVLGLAIGGLPAVLIAAYLVKALPLDAIRILVVFVVLYTAYGMLAAARRERVAGLTAVPAPAPTASGATS